MAITRAGERLVAVGPRGLIVGSDDHGKTWSQAKVPVQSDLLSVHFPTALDGWAAGHDGVILHTADGGKSWVKQLDGRVAGDTFKAYYSKNAAGPVATAALAQLEQNYKAGAALPFLDIWFESAETGFAVGSFGMVVATTDGGKTWEPWLDRIDNSQSLNLNAVRGIAGDIYIVGEHGQVYRLDRAQRRFTKTDTGYNGSFFGITGNGETLLAYGLRGTAYRTAKSGTGGFDHWEVVSMPNEQTISDGVTTRGGFILVNGAGQFLIGDAAAKDFRVQAAAKPMRMTGLVALDDTTVVVTGLDGVRTESVREAEVSSH